MHFKQIQSPKMDDSALSIPFPKADVILIAFGLAGTSVERFKVANELWNAGISTDLSYMDAQEDLLMAAKFGKTLF